MEVDAKIVDMAILGTPITRSKGFKILAYFTLLCRPMRIEDCKLVLSPGGKYLIWTPDEAIKIMGWARQELAETARQALVEAQKRVAV